MNLPIGLTERIILNKDDFAETVRMIATIDHALCRRAVNRYWIPCWDDERGNAIIMPNSIFWLYFWAETGQGSRTATLQARRVFFNIFGSERPYKGAEPEYQNFFRIFDTALEATGLEFRTHHGDSPRNNPVRDALRPEMCTEHCREVFRQVLGNMRGL